MSAFLNALKAAPKTSRVKVNVFLASFTLSTQKINIFLEGRDDPSFIRVHVTKIAADLNLQVITTVLGTKKEVLSAYQYLGKRFPDNPRLMFFVDKDHDDLIGNKGAITERGLFVTPYYSIENFLVSTHTIEVVLTDLWGLDSSSGAIEAACKSFEKFQQAYRSVFLPWMGWLLATRRLRGNAQNENVPFSILTINNDYDLTLNWTPDIFSYLSEKYKVTASPD